MADHPTTAAARVILEYKNKKPLDLLEFTRALKAVGDQYRRYSSEHFPAGASARLAVGRIESGSVIAQLIPILETADWLSSHRDLVGPFVAQVGDFMEAIRHFPPSARAIPKADIRAAKDVVAPVAHDPGGQVNIYASDGATIITKVYNFGTNGSRELRKHADIILAGLPEELTFESDPMVLYQLRDGPAGSAGDYGFIDRFSEHPVRIRWLSESVKREVLERAENVFDLVFFVTGQARTAAGEVVSYDIRRLDDVAYRSAGR